MTLPQARAGLLPLAATLVISATAATMARGQDEDTEARRRWERERTELLKWEAERFADGRSDEGEIALGIWEWRLETGSVGRRCVDEARSWLQGPARELLDALVDPPPLPRIDEEDDATALTTLLVDPVDEPVLARAVRSARFCRVLDHLGVEAATASLDPTHPWVADARERWARVAPRIERVEELFRLLALPADPRRAERVELFAPGQKSLVQEFEDQARGGWVLSMHADDLHVIDDRLRVRRIPVETVRPALARSDVQVELRRWAMPRKGIARAGQDPLDLRGPGATVLRAWWAAARGERWTAARILEQLQSEYETPDDLLFAAAEELARAAYEAALVALSTGAQREGIVLSLERAAALLEAFSPAGKKRSSLHPDLLFEVSDLARRLSEQEASLRAAPPVPPWAEWQHLGPAERIPYLVRALPDCDGDPTDRLGFGGGGVHGASQRVPADAPVADVDAQERDFVDPVWYDWTRRRPSEHSAADELVRCGEVAIPALIAALGDMSPTRCVASDRGGGRDEDVPLFALTVGDCADEVFRAILNDHDLWLSLAAGLPDARDQRHRERQARVSAWWAAAAPRGGLVGHHLARLVAVDRELSRVDSRALTAARGRRGGALTDLDAALLRRAHHLEWLLAHAGGREVETVRALVSAAPHTEAKTQWLELLREAPHDGYDAFLAAELAAEDDGVAIAAAAALVARGDRQGLKRAIQVIANPDARDDVVASALFVARACEVEFARLAARLVNERPGCDEAVCWALHDAPDSVERTLALARIAARPVRPGTDSFVAPRMALDSLDPPSPGDLTVLGEEEGRRVVVRELARALRTCNAPELFEHAAVTAACLGRSSIAALSSAVGVNMRASLQGALCQGDPVRREAAVLAVSRLDVESLAWLAEGADHGTAEVLEQLRRRTALRVVELVIGPEVDGTVRSVVEPWRGAPLNLDLVSDLLEAWERGEGAEITVLIERRPGEGVAVRVSTPAVPAPDLPGWLLEIEAEGPCLPRETGADELAPSVRSTHALTPIQNALEDHPDAPARLEIRARR